MGAEAEMLMTGDELVIGRRPCRGETFPGVNRRLNPSKLEACSHDGAHPRDGVRIP
jgi:hypothetical protein